MAEMTVSVEKITGKPKSEVASRVFVKRVTLADATVGTLVSCLLAHGEGADRADVLSAIFEIAERKLEGAEEGILAALEATALPTKNYNSSLEISLVHAFFYEDVCYIVKIGNEVKVLVFDPPKSTEIKFESGSGPISGGQLYLFATEAFLSTFDTSVLAQDAELDFGDIIDGIATEIAGEENQSEVGAAFVSVKGEQVAEVAKKVEETVGVEGQSDEGAKQGEETMTVDATAESERGDEEEAKETEEEQGTEDVEKVYEIVPGKTTGQQTGVLSGIAARISTEFGRLVHGDIGAIRRNIVAVAVVVVLVLAISVGFTLYKKSEGERQARFREHMSAASAKYSEAVAVAELNKSRARDILIEADREVKFALEIRSEDSEAKKLAGDIEQKLKETETTATVELSEVVDLADSVVSLSISGNNLAAVSDGKVYEVNLATKDTTDVTSDGGVQVGVVFDGRAFLSSGEKIYRIDIADEKHVDVGERSGGLDIGVFAGNVYVLSENSITKFVPIEAGYSLGTEYLNSPETFTPGSHFAIDGSIWVSAGGKILKFTRGEKESFEISGLVGGVGEFSLIYTTPDLDNLYVVDLTNSALLVISKEGVYKGVLQSPEFSRASDLVVDETEERVYISSGSKVLEASIK